MIHLLKRRLGFATNSSSVHSIVFHRKHEYKDSEDAVAGDFGWGYWTAASTQTKRLYWASQLRNNLSTLTGGRMPMEYYNLLSATLCGVDPGSSYIDHQSYVPLPRQLRSRVLDNDYYRQLVNALDDERILLLGGNDNDDHGHPASEGGSRLVLPFSDLDVDTEKGDVWGSKRRCLVAKYDDLHDQWVLFNQYTGEKVRLSFARLQQDIAEDDYYPDLAARYNAPSGFPELIDIKITDYCERGCVFCYQRSTRRGKHATYQDLRHVVDVLAGAGVLEAAIGGGEPTKHPDFHRILQLFREKDIIPNFSTGDLSWLEDAAIRSAVIENVGGWAYTVRTQQDVDDLLQHVKSDGGDFRTETKSGGFRDRPNAPVVSVHIVLGTVERNELRSIMEKCAAYNLTTTLLGYKAVGKAKGKKPINYDWLLDDINAMRDHGFDWNVSVDTAVVQQFGDRLGSPLYYDKYEAARSMYVDAVAGTVAPYSYVEQHRPFKYMKPYDDEWLYKPYHKAVKQMQRAGTDDAWNDPKLKTMFDKAYHRGEALKQQYRAKGAKALLKAFRAFQRKEIKR